MCVSDAAISLSVMRTIRYDNATDLPWRNFLSPDSRVCSRFQRALRPMFVRIRIFLKTV